MDAGAGGSRSEVIVRAAEAADGAAMLAIFNHAVANTTAVFQSTPRTAAEQERWFAQARELDMPVLVAALADGRVVGFAACSPFRKWPGYRYSVESSVYVAPEAQRRGVGAALLSTLIAEVRAKGVHAIIAGVDAHNVASLRLHERLGFVRVGYLREVGHKFGRWLDLIFLERIV